VECSGQQGLLIRCAKFRQGISRDLADQPGNLLAGQMSGRQKAGRKVIFRCCRTIKEADANANARVIKFSNKNQNQNQELHNPQRQEERGSGSARELQTVWFGFGLGLGLVFGPLHRRTSGQAD